MKDFALKYSEQIIIQKENFWTVLKTITSNIKSCLPKIIAFAFFHLTPYFIMLKNGQTYFKNLAVFTPQDFKSMFGHFSTL